MKLIGVEELLQKLMLEAYKINRDTKHSIFLDFFGHTNELDLQIHTNGWKSGVSADIKKTVYLNRNDTLEQLDKLLDILKEVKELC